MSPVFADMRVVQGSLEAIAQGLNPQVTNLGDPWGRPMNYPSVWIVIAQVLGLQYETNYLVFSLFSIAGFIYCCYNIVMKSESVWTLLVVFSGATLLVIERGNNDLIIFMLLFLSAESASLLRVVPIVIAIILKIYPVLVIPAFIKSRKAMLGLAAMSLIVLLCMWQELVLIRAATPVAAGLSYGVASMAAAAAMTPLKLPLAFLIVVMVACVLIVYAIRFDFLKMDASKADVKTVQWFLLGACTYVGTFLLSSNWDYRLIFLIFCIPYILAISEKLPRYLLLACILIASNQLILYFVFGVFGVAVNILAKCVIFAMMGAIVLKILETEIPLLRRFLLYIPTLPKSAPH